MPPVRHTNGAGAAGGCACVGMCVPCSGLVIEGQREALERCGTRRELEGAADALRELALDARLLTVRARRACGQALELFVQRLCV